MRASEPFDGWQLDGVTFRARGRTTPILAIESLTLGREPIAITGPSGSGKTTLLNLLAGIETPTEGYVTFRDFSVSAAGDATRAAWRRRTLGFVFQDFQLIPALSALDNVLLPWRFDHAKVPATARAEAREALRRLGVTADRPARVLSRGEQQRVAILRALTRRPAALLADEPTASLDAETGRQITDLLLAEARDAHLVIVSHDANLLARMGRVIAVRDGVIAEAKPA